MACALMAQQRTPETTFRAETGLMLVEVHVKGRDGKPVAGLERRDFQLKENGVRQEIANMEFVAGLGESALAVSAAPETFRIYIAAELAPPSVTCGSTAEYELFYRGVRKFLEKQWRPGVAVSFNGTAFMADRGELLETLELLRKHPSGRSNPGKPDWLPALVTEDGTLQQGLECDPMAHGRVRLLVNRTLARSGRTTLERYIDLTRKLGQLEGKKVVVVFSRGLALTSESTFAVNRLAREALRSRVSFYSVLPTALTAPNAMLAEDGSPRRVTEGLFAVAENTGGRAVQSTNDFSDVFPKVYSDNANYYVVEYYPRDREEKGRFRDIRVTVAKPGVHVETARKGYFEDKPFADLTAEEKKSLLEFQALGPASYTEIPVRAGFEFFRGAKNQSIVAFSVGIPAGSMPGRQEKDRLTVHLKIAARAEALASKQLPVISEQTIQIALPVAEVEKGRTDPAALFQFPGRMELSPGKYEWKVVVRDERAGKVGSYQAVIDVPDFDGAVSPSSLLLTSQRIPKRKDEVSGVVAGPHEYVQQPGNVFRRGQLVFAVYELYGVPAELLQAPPGPRAFLIHQEKPLAQPPLRKYDAVPSAEQKSLSYVAYLDTGDLAPGEYNLIMALPESKNGISRKFTVVEK